MRDDFFYRLCSNMIEVPPLRARLAESADELAELVAHLCTRITGNDDLAAEVTAALERDLGRDYAFPGNVRELEQCVRRVLMTGGCARDDKADGTEAQALAAAIEAGTLTAEALHRALLRAAVRAQQELRRGRAHHRPRPPNRQEARAAGERKLGAGFRSLTAKGTPKSAK